MERNRKEGDTEFARALRRNTTRGEKRFWAHLRRGNYGFKFRRQHAVDGYVLDFYSPELRLAFEIDGPFHDPSKDKFRDEFFAERGIKTVRLRSLSMFKADRDIGAFVEAHVGIRAAELGISKPPPPQRFPLKHEHLEGEPGSEPE